MTMGEREGQNYRGDSERPPPPSRLRSRVDNLACSSSCAQLVLEEEKEKITKKKVRKAEVDVIVPMFTGSVSPIERPLGV